MSWGWWLAIWIVWLPVLFALARLCRAIAARRRLRAIARLLMAADVRAKYGDDWEEFVDDSMPLCPACLRLLALHRAHPRLSLRQLEAVVDQQVALGRCPAHGDVVAP